MTETDRVWLSEVTIMSCSQNGQEMNIESLKVEKIFRLLIRPSSPVTNRNPPKEATETCGEHVL